MKNSAQFETVVEYKMKMEQGVRKVMRGQKLKVDVK
jgi:hypothetical protein